MILDGILHGTTSPPLCTEAARWELMAVNDLKVRGLEIIKNAWRKSGYSWFPIGDGVAAGEVVVTAEADVAPGDKGIEGNTNV